VISLPPRDGILKPGRSCDPGAAYEYPNLGCALDHLEAQLTGQSAFPIYANSKDKFFYKVVEARLDFEREAGGKVIAVVLHQNGRDMRAPRVMTQP
jgi:hypothetical protein